MVLFEFHSPHVSASFLESSRHSDLSGVFSRHSSHLEEKAVLCFAANDDKPSARAPHRYICSFVVIYTMIFFNGCCFTAVAPSVPFYLQFLMAPPAFLGWVVSFYSLGQIFGSPIAGWLSNDISSKSLLTISSILGLVSSVLYAVAPGYVFVLFSRLMTGISAGMEFTTELTTIANSTTVIERTRYLASVTACNVVGFIMGPALGTGLAILDLHVLGLTIDQNTGPGWLLAAMFLVDLIMLQLFFKEPAVAEYDSSKAAEPSEQTELLRNKEQSDASYGGVNFSMKRMQENTQECANVSASGGRHKDAKGYGGAREPPPSLFLILTLIFVQFSLMCGFSLLETITSPLVQDEFAWTLRNSNLLFTCGGVFSLVLYVAFMLVSNRVQDRWLVFSALVLCSLGFMLAVDWNQLNWVPTWFSALLPAYLARFLVGFALIYAGFMTGRSLVFALYSKLIAQQYQGKYLGWMVAGGSAARTLGPFAAVSLYYGIESAGEHLLALFGSVGVFHLACLLLVFCQWPQLLPGNSELPMSLAINKGHRHMESVATLSTASLSDEIASV